MKVLVAIDSSSDSKEVVEQISHRPWRSGTEIKLIHVVESPLPPLPDLMGVGAEASRRTYEEEVASGTKLLETMTKTMRSNAEVEISITNEIISASYAQTPPQVIVEEAQRYDADLIVVGSRGMSTWKRFLVGSVSMAVVEHAPCSVEVVRAKRKT